MFPKRFATFWRALGKTATCFSIIPPVPAWCYLDVKAGSPDGWENILDHSEKGWSLKPSEPEPSCVYTKTQLCCVCVFIWSAVCSSWCLVHDSASVGVQVPASSPCPGQSLGRQWFTSRNKCFARVGPRRDYLLKHGVVTSAAFVTSELLIFVRHYLLIQVLSFSDR